MTDDDTTLVDPMRIATLEDLARELGRLRRRAARPGQVQLSVRDIAARIGKAPSTLDPYLRGQRLCPADVYEEILRALGVKNSRLRPWLDAWERLADTAPAPGRLAPVTAAARRRRAEPASRRPRPLSYVEEFRYDLVPAPPHASGIGIVTGDLRRVRCAEVWVNSENTSMRMPRYEEYSISAIIRFEGALRDETGRVVHDHIADELTRKVAGRTPVAPGTAIATGSGELARSNGVRYVIHVAAVQGEPGEGYRQVLDVGRCVTNALAEAERLGTGDDAPVRSILFPLLGTGVGGGDLEPTFTVLLGAAMDYLAARPDTGIKTVYFLAYTDIELDVCRRVLDHSSRLCEICPPLT